MKISFNWLKKYISLDQTPEAVAKLLTHSGLEVEGLELQESFPGGLKHYVVGHVLSCEKHPNADKLSKTTVDVGNGTILPIVCGAPNVGAGQKVVVALPGAEVRIEGKEPFVIQKTKIRGEVSEGMICAEDELGIGLSHQGITILEDTLIPGTPAAELFNVKSDTVIEIGLTPNRADAASHLGVARELKALLKQPLSVKLSDYSHKSSIVSPVKVLLQHAGACPRYAGIYIKGVKVKESPEWLQTALKSIGLSPVSNIVDITNYILHGLGQPMHAFDADKIRQNQITIKTAVSGTTFLTLDGKERKLTDTDLIIANAETPMAIAGVFGGKDSGVSSGTTNVFLESAYFNPDFIRKTAQRLAIKTDASFRYERGTNPDMVIPALKHAAALVLEIAGGEASDIIDEYPLPVMPFEVKLEWNKLNRLVGVELPRQTVKEILTSLEIEITSETAEGLQLSVPAYRVDVQREADIVEEILRIYGYNNIASRPYLSSEYLASFPVKDHEKTKLNLGRLLVAKGFSEIYTNSLTAFSNLTDDANGVKILNALSSELDVMRQTLLPSALEVISHNINRKQKDLKLYEFGFVYNLKKNEINRYKEELYLTVVLTGNQLQENWQNKVKPVSFYDLKNIVAEVLTQFGVTEFQLQPVINKWYLQSVEIISRKKSLGLFGQVSHDFLKKKDIKQDVFAAELNINTIFSLESKALSYKELPRYPEVRRDLSLVIDKNVKFEDIERLARKTEPVLLHQINIFDVFEGESLGQGKKAYSVSYLLQDETKTLTDIEIDSVMTKMITVYESELGAVIRR